MFACRDSIIPLADSCAQCHNHCCRYLSSAHSLLGDTHRIALECMNTPKLSSYCGRLIEKEFKATTAPTPGRESVRFLTAMTSRGIVPFIGTAKALCDRVYLINDDLGAISRFLLHRVRSGALAAGYDVISCYCPLAPFEKLEHLFVPQLGLGFVTSNRFHNFEAEVDPWRIVNCRRFSDNDLLKKHKQRILFNRKSAAQMLGQAHALMQDAKKNRDELKTYYRHATDFTLLDDIADSLIDTLEEIG